MLDTNGCAVGVAVLHVQGTIPATTDGLNVNNHARSYSIGSTGKNATAIGNFNVQPRL